jgi:hypothetical protein
MSSGRFIIILTLHTFGEYLDFHPHVHALVADGLFVRPCPVCQNPMRVIAVIDDPGVVEQILRHFGAWHDPPPRPPPQRVPSPYTYEPCDDVDPTMKTSSRTDPA